MTGLINPRLNTPHNTTIVVLYNVKISITYNIILYDRKFLLLYSYNKHVFSLLSIII